MWFFSDQYCSVVAVLYWTRVLKILHKSQPFITCVNNSYNKKRFTVFSWLNAGVMHFKLGPTDRVGVFFKDLKESFPPIFSPIKRRGVVDLAFIQGPEYFSRIFSTEHFRQLSFLSQIPQFHSVEAKFNLNTHKTRTFPRRQVVHRFSLIFF